MTWLTTTEKKKKKRKKSNTPSCSDSLAQRKDDYVCLESKRHSYRLPFKDSISAVSKARGDAHHPLVLMYTKWQIRSI